MKVNIETLQIGSVVTKDVMGKTSYPIIPKNTVITEKELEILRAFLIKEIEIKKQLVTGEKAIIDEKVAPVTKREKTIQTTKKGFVEEYRFAVEQYKHEFTTWQSGGKVNISKIREILSPAFEASQKSKSWIRSIHQYANKEEYHYYHTVAIGLIAGYIAKELGLNKGNCFQIALAGCLADCGMAKLPPNLLSFDKSLTSQSWAEIKKHPIHSYQMVKNITLLKPEMKLAILQHHERIDGTGYPLAEKGDRVHKYSQIIAIADIYHAMTSERPYKKAQSPFKVLQSMEEDQFGKLDVSVLNILVTAITNLPLGTSVSLSNGDIGKIIFVKPELPTRPMVKINDTGEILDLINHRDIYIENVIY